MNKKNKIIFAVGILFILSFLVSVLSLFSSVEENTNIIGSVLAALICLAAGAAMIFYVAKNNGGLKSAFHAFVKRTVNDEIVFIIPGSSVYHEYEFCPTLSNSTDYKEITEKEALKLGLRKCKQCGKYEVL